MTTKVPSRSDIETAAFRNGSRIRRTPVLTLAAEDSGLSGNVVLKLEFLQHRVLQGSGGAELRPLRGGGYVGCVRSLGRKSCGGSGMGRQTRRDECGCFCAIQRNARQDRSH